MKSVKIYYLATCDTCRKILVTWNAGPTAVMQDIKTEKMTEAQVDEMAKLAGSYEALFSRVALKYKSMGLGKLTLTEEDYRRLILEEYTFLKRPVAIIDGRIFVGNSPKNVQAAAEALRA